MNSGFYQNLTKKSISKETFSLEECEFLLSSPDINLLSLINAAFEVRRTYWGKMIKIHILNNVQNGLCSEDCSYCAQSKNSQAPIEKYFIKSDEEILKEAKNAYEKGAFRYCMVFSGKGPTDQRIDHLCQLIQKIKSLYPIEVCVSAGIVNQQQAEKLKNCGLDRMNHNLNTSEELYEKICSTHDYQDRINTLESAHSVGLQICAGVIVGMGEEIRDVFEMAQKLHSLKAESIPINFFIPIKGAPLKTTSKLTPEYCLRVLCLFRFLNPQAEIRVAAGREMHLRNMQVLAFYPANSLFLDGYLNARGSSRKRTLQMLCDAGFEIESNKTLEELIEKENQFDNMEEATDLNNLKNLEELRPHLGVKNV